MSLVINAITVDARDPVALARFWEKALGWVEVGADEVSVLIAPSKDRPTGPAPAPILFLANDEPKTVKNRWHLDLAPDDQAAEVARLEALGARRVDIGQGDAPWVVMADPEGNEFCVLRDRPKG